jgi:pimeloyl-ACP methyl ester carboxylesterase
MYNSPADFSCINSFTGVSMKKYLQFGIRTTLFVMILFTSFHANSKQTLEPKLLNYQFLGTIDQEYAATILKKSPAFAKLNVSFDSLLYKISYQTSDPFGKKSTASGLIAIPSVNEQQGIVVYLHGTRVKHDDVPSSGDTAKYQTYPALFSNAGAYVLVMPDYLGYGDSTLRPHPYMQAKSLARVSIDMLKVSRIFLYQLNLKLNDKLYLAGYSEGGFSTMAMFEALQKNSPDIPISAVAPGSGAYDMDATLSYILKNPGENASLYTALYFYAIQNYKHYWNDFSIIFRTPYDTLVPQLFDGTHDANTIRAMLAKTPESLLKREFFDAFMTGSEKHLNLIRKQFNRYGFTPKAPLLLLGTKGDTDVPFNNTLIAYEKLKEKSNAVSYKSVSDTYDHRQAFPYIMLEQYLFFKKH